MTALTNEQWAMLKPLLPKQKNKSGGRPRADDQKTVNGILWVLRTGAQWNEMPKKYGAYVTAWRRLQRWEADGTWRKIWKRLLKVLDEQDRLLFETSFMDGSFAPAKKGDLVWVSPRKARGQSSWF